MSKPMLVESTKIGNCWYIARTDTGEFMKLRGRHTSPGWTSNMADASGSSQKWASEFVAKANGMSLVSSTDLK